MELPVQPIDDTKFEDDMSYVAKAHDSLLCYLFGEVPEDISKKVVSRNEYKEALQAIQKDYGLTEGDSRYVLFVLEQLSRSPKFKEE